MKILSILYWHFTFCRMYKSMLELERAADKYAGSGALELITSQNQV